ncbi:MAG: secretion protein [Burkholderia sp.]|jgi:type III secretion protein D|uniref:secretion protein n=3 Tax=Burkholderia sp. TaxID=36773 RepID=UPI0025883BF1|nr:secretion protein [Burkholderia sp.]MCA3780493.1 secretion protein [Burkholderia sp.]MCA3791080.1 secretion protein [Burkholderia sp.]MCA3801588.1 secretion protein [Burkholderia sp.]MCA3809584.1 secretion protein [Burkholderia sp.]MCA3817551.1 secretion protein [Burkholderia sp.]
MKLLRILTGHHAGAQVHLEPGAYRVGADDDADIQLTDWRGADVLLVVESNGAVSSQRLEHAAANDSLAALAVPPADPPHDGDDASAGQDDEPPATLDPCKVWMVDFVPLQFDDIALCIGWADDAWPSDLALLSTLLTGPARASNEGDGTPRGAARVKRLRYAGIVAACVAVGAGVAGLSFALTTNVSRAALAPPDVLLEQRVNRALADAHLNELHAARDGGEGAARAVVTGMVRSANDDHVARQLFDRMKPAVIVRRYRVADDIARGIRDAVDVDGVQVAYDGHGVFTVSGAVADRQRVENALTRIRGDFDKSVTQIRVALTDIDLPAPAPKQGNFTALLSSGDVRYAETPDGVKHIYPVPDTADDSAPEAGAASAPAEASATPAAPAAPPVARVDPVPLPSDDRVAAASIH